MTGKFYRVDYVPALAKTQRCTDTDTGLLVCSQKAKIQNDLVLESRVLVSRRLEDKNESLDLGLQHLVLVLVSVLKKKSCSFSRLLV